MSSTFSLDLTRADGRRSLNLIGVLFETVLRRFSLLTRVMSAYPLTFVQAPTFRECPWGKMEIRVVPSVRACPDLS